MRRSSRRGRRLLLLLLLSLRATSLYKVSWRVAPAYLASRMQSLYMRAGLFVVYLGVPGW